MKKILFLLFAATVVISCDITEKVYINEDNSVNYALQVDMSAISQMMGMREENTGENFPIDTVMTVQEFAREDFLGDKKKVNEEDVAHLEKIYKDFKVYVMLNENEGYFSLFTQQKSIADFNRTMHALKVNLEKENIGDTDAEEATFNGMMGNLQLNFDGKTFSRTGTVDMQQFSSTSDEDASELQNLAGMFSYELEYHFPRPVKTVSDTTVLMSWDRKTVYMKKPFTSLLKDKNTYNFTVELE